MLDNNALVGLSGHLIGSGGQDRTADLGVMNHHPGKNLSLCLFYGCSHQEFSSRSRPFLFLPVLYLLNAVNSGHKLDTRKWTEPLPSVETVFNWQHLLLFCAMRKD